MICLVPSRPTIRLLLVFALSLMLSCVTAPGIRTSDVAELHYGDLEDAVVEKLGDGTEVLYFILDGKQYRYRLYTTKYINDVYALLFMEGELAAVNDKKQDFSECLNIKAETSWEQCLSEKLSDMQFQVINLSSHDFSHGINTEQEEQTERNSMRAGALAVAIPLSVALPGIVPTFCIMSCGQCDVGAKPSDYQNRCIGQLEETLNAGLITIQGDISRTALIEKLDQIYLAKNVFSTGKSASLRNDYEVLYYSWGCGNADNSTLLLTTTGLYMGILKWAWFRFVQENSVYMPSPFKYCEGTWSELQECAKEKQYRSTLEKDIGTYCPNADLGHADAQTYVGDLYFLGAYDLRKNLIQAYVWYSLGARNGNSYAASQLDKVIIELSPDKLLEAQHYLEQWKTGQCERDLFDAISNKDE
jgi:hypothetical protein